MTSLRTIVDILGLTAFATFALCGVLITALAPFSEAVWWLWPALRAGLQSGSGLWGGLSIAGLAGARSAGHLKLGLCGAMLGTLLAVNPVLDLLRGPLILEDVQILSSGSQRLTRFSALSNGGIRRGDGIRGSLWVEAVDGAQYAFSPMGLQANRLESMLTSCKDPTSVRVVALRHLDTVVALRCSD